MHMHPWPLLSMLIGAGSPEEQTNLLIYVSLGVATAALQALQTLLLTSCSLRASRQLHALLVRRLLNAPLTFFDATTTGAILNRFLSDTQLIDSSVPDSLLSLATQLLTMLTQVALVLYFAPWVALGLPPLLCAYYAVYQRMRAAARDARRIASAAHTPVFSHYADAIAGSETIRAFDASERFCDENVRRVANLSRAKVMTEAVQKWAQTLSVQAGTILYLLSGIACVILHACGLLTTAQMGLVLLYAGTLQRASMDLMMRMTAIETEFVCVERIAEFLRIEQDTDMGCGGEDVGGGSEGGGGGGQCGSGESGAGGGGHTVLLTAAHWEGHADVAPRGAIEMNGVVLRYHPSRPPALRNFCISLPAGTHAAVCGRTGCGKSSLLRVLPRLYAIDHGKVLIDGVDIHSVPMHTLRRQVRLLAQDAVLLRGSLFENLTAFAFSNAGANTGVGTGTRNGTGCTRNGNAMALEDRSSTAAALTSHETGQLAKAEVGDEAAAEAEAEARRIFESLGLRARIDSLADGLHTSIEAANLSEGERQLMSLARALVAHGGKRQLRVLLCDEPTSNVDFGSDGRVMDMLLALDCTLLINAHRLHHVRRLDRVCVLDNGRLVEEGAPAQLLATPNSRLAAMVRANTQASPP